MPTAIKEIGDGSVSPFPYEHAFSEFMLTTYEFHTDENSYVVELELDVDPDRKEGQFLKVDFKSWDETVGDYDAEAVTGENKPLRVVATVVAIIKDFENNRLEDTEDQIRDMYDGGVKNPGVVGVVYKPAKRSSGDDARERLYRAAARARGYEVQKQDVNGSQVSAVMFESSLNELGDSRNPYDWKLGYSGVSDYSIEFRYSFQNQHGSDYEVKISTIPSKNEAQDLEVTFETHETSSGLTDDHDVFRVMATVADILESFAKDEIPDIEAELEQEGLEGDAATVRYLKFRPAVRKRNYSKLDNVEDSGRFKLYNAFIEDRGFDVEMVGSVAYIDLKENVNELGDNREGYDFNVSKIKLRESDHIAKVVYRFTDTDFDVDFKVIFWVSLSTTPDFGALDDGGGIGVAFETERGGYGETNTGNQFRIMATIVNVVDDFLESGFVQKVGEWVCQDSAAAQSSGRKSIAKIENYENTNINHLYFDPVRKEGEDGLAIETSRSKLYQAYARHKGYEFINASPHKVAIRLPPKYQFDGCGKQQESVVNELGDTREGYEFRQSKTVLNKDGHFGSIRYEFEDSDHDITYTVSFTIGSGINDFGALDDYSAGVDVSFRTDKNGYSETNTGNQFRVMATIINIIDDFLDGGGLKKFGDWLCNDSTYASRPVFGDQNTEITHLYFDPTRKDGEHGSALKTSRSKLYRAYARHKGYEFEEISWSTVAVKLPNKHKYDGCANEVNELGDTREGYDFRLQSTNLRPGLSTCEVQYEFSTKSNTEYVVKFGLIIESHMAQQVWVDFITEDGLYDVTNEGDFAKVVATVFNIVEHFVEDGMLQKFQDWLCEDSYYSDDIKNLRDPVIRSIAFSAARKGYRGKNKRVMLYKAFANARGYDYKPEGRDGGYFEIPERHVPGTCLTAELNELGEGVKPYEFWYGREPRFRDYLGKHGTAEVEYVFENDMGTEYGVNIDVWAALDADYQSAKVQFGYGKYRKQDATNEGDQYRVMSTIVAILEEYIEKDAEEISELLKSESERRIENGEEPFKNTEVGRLEFRPQFESDDKDRGIDKAKRTRLYRLYAKNRGLDVKEEGGKMVIDLKENKLTESKLRKLVRQRPRLRNRIRSLIR